jgi:hypothetical protein
MPTLHVPKVRIVVEVDGEQFIVEKPGSHDDLSVPVETPPMSPTFDGQSEPTRGLDFSPIEALILRAVSADWQTAAELAAKVGQKRSTWFNAILSNLVERRWLDGGRHGYRLRPGVKIDFL